MYDSRASGRCCTRSGANSCDAQSLRLGSFASEAAHELCEFNKGRR